MQSARSSCELPLFIFARKSNIFQWLVSSSCSSSLGQSSISMSISSSSSSSSQLAGLRLRSECEPSPLSSSCCMRLCLVRRFWNHTFTCVSERLRDWASALRSAPTTYWLLSKACSSFSSCEGEKAVRMRFGLRKGWSKKSKMEKITRENRD